MFSVKLNHFKEFLLSSFIVFLLLHFNYRGHLVISFRFPFNILVPFKNLFNFHLNQL